MKGIDSVLEHNDIAIVKRLKANKYANNSMGRDGEYIKAIRHKLSAYLQPIITQYFIDNKSEIWLLFLIAHSKR